MPLKRPPEPWHSFLAALDKSLSVKVTLHCVGGFVLAQVYGLPRPTTNVDVLAVVPDEQRGQVQKIAGEGSPLHKKHGMCLDQVTVSVHPKNYARRLVEMFPGAYRRLHLYALEAHDLALTKLVRNQQRDRDDVKHLARSGRISLDTLRKRYERELRPNLGNPQREDLTLELWIEAIAEERRTRS